MADKSINSPFIKFTYTILNPDGTPNVKSLIIHVSSIVSIESVSNHDMKFVLSNNQVININIGKDNNAEKLMNEILKLEATGINYSVYKINSCKM
tara:strand:+ start:219 stop:503 length:285 start_codon:yes stop_codon:yes gene_type:complete